MTKQDSLQGSILQGPVFMTTDNGPFHHRSSLKQKNKPFKGSSKQVAEKGRVEKRPLTSSKSTKHGLNKQERRNLAQNMQLQKRLAAQQAKRIYSGMAGAPRIVTVIPISASADTASFLSLALSNDEQMINDFSCISYSAPNRQKFLWSMCPRQLDSSRWLVDTLRAANVADCIVFLASNADSVFDDLGLKILSILQNQGVSSSISVLQDTKSECDNKTKAAIKKEFLSRIQDELSSVEKVFLQSLFLNDPTGRDLLEFKRSLAQQKLAGISWRETRPYLVPEEVSRDGSLVKVRGYVRGGKPFSANRLVEIPGVGTFTLSHIEQISTRKIEELQQTMNTDGNLTQYVNLDECESLESFNASDPFSAENLMEIAEQMELEKHELTGHGKSFKKRTVPKGTSSYQAAWIIDDEEEDGDEESGEYEGEQDEKGKRVSREMEQEEKNAESVSDDDTDKDMEQSGDDNDRVVHFAMDKEDEIEKLPSVEEQAAFFEEKKRNRHYIDEVDVPEDSPAQVRFQRYRGIKSLRTSAWDPYENLPLEYSKIFNFENYGLSERRAIKENDSPMIVGSSIILYIKDVPESVGMDRIRYIFGLHKYEQKMSVLNFSFTVKEDVEVPLVNKERLVAFFGFRSFIINPIWSENSNFPLHRILRTVEPGSNAVGTAFVPVHFRPCPVLLFRCNADESDLKLVATGTVLGANPNRINLKRITLTATPFRMNNRSVVARFMFSNPKDVNWFKPVELTTYSGQRGHIKESLGTHGYMKCLFEKPIKPNEIIAMHLYKRVFPKCTTKEYF